MHSKLIGRKQTVKYAAYGLITAFVLFFYLVGGFENPSSGFESMFAEYTLNYIIGAISILLVAYALGGYAGQWIIDKQWNSLLVGVLTTFLVLSVGTFLGSILGFLQEGIYDSFGIRSGMYDYLVKPVLIVLFWGAIPWVILGMLLGRAIKR